MSDHSDISEGTKKSTHVNDTSGHTSHLTADAGANHNGRDHEKAKEHTLMVSGLVDDESAIVVIKEVHDSVCLNLGHPSFHIAGHSKTTDTCEIVESESGLSPDVKEHYIPTTNSGTISTDAHEKVSDTRSESKKQTTPQLHKK